jgi:hypothetical protein
VLAAGIAVLAVVGPAIGLAADAPGAEIGRRIFREGRLSSGEPLTAIVSGDVPVTGTQFSCQSCHGRSGMGAGEGGLIVPPVSSLLFVPSSQRRRPAYDLGLLARALREGVDPSGRTLDPLMPRYRLPDADVAGLFSYLRELSAGPSPGVSDEAIRFAAVFTDDVPAARREAVLDVLRTYLAEKNRQTRLERRRIGHGAPPGERRPTTYRDWVLDVWELGGPPEGWEAELEARYRAGPVFALLGGTSGRSWEPVARFCERHEIPALLPTTELPDTTAGHFYTLYFSRGLFLEADLVASHLAEGPTRPLAQVYREGGPGREAARRLETVLAGRGRKVATLPIDPGVTRPLAALGDRLGGGDAVLWLARADLAGLGEAKLTGRVYLSSTLLERDLEGLSAGAATFAAHPYALAGRPEPALARFKAWLARSGVPLRDERRQAEAYFACLAANEALMHAGRFFVRDYVLDRLDHAEGLVAYLPLYARPGAGPGQRFLAKGGYLVPLEAGRPALDRATWIVP